MRLFSKEKSVQNGQSVNSQTMKSKQAGNKTVNIPIKHHIAKALLMFV